MIKSIKYLCIIIIMILVVGCELFEDKKEGEETNGIGAVPSYGDCWCTKYVANQLDITHYPDAYKWNETTLSSSGTFTLKVIPKNGDVVVFAPGYQKMHETAGHIGFVQDVYKTNNGFIISVRGANQTGQTRDWISECKCNNISIWKDIEISYTDISKGKVKFFRDNIPNFNCSGFYIPEPPVLMQPENECSDVSIPDRKSTRLNSSH